MVADGQGNLVTRDTLHQWQSVSDQNVSSMAHVAARDFGFLTLTRPSTARIYNQTREKIEGKGHGFVIGADGTNNRSLLESAIRPRRSALAALDCPSLSVASLCCR